MSANVGFLGLGNMGFLMARNLLRNGTKVFVYNRSKEKALPLLEEGAELLNFPKEAWTKTSIVFSMVANDQALQALMEGSEGLLTVSKPGCIHVSMSTISPELSRHLAAQHHEKGLKYVAAPVFGRPEAAAQQNLSICMAGDCEAKRLAEPLLQHLGKKIYDFGEEPEKANCVKLAGNFFILAIIELMAEAFSFVKKSHIPVDKFHSCLAESLFPSPVFKNYGRILINQNFTPAGFKMLLGLKDINLFLHEAHALNVPLPIADLLRNRLLTALANNREELDWSAIALSAMEDAGLHQED